MKKKLLLIVSVLMLATFLVSCGEQNARQESSEVSSEAEGISADFKTTTEVIVSSNENGVPNGSAYDSYIFVDENDNELRAGFNISKNSTIRCKRVESWGLESAAFDVVIGDESTRVEDSFNSGDSDYAILYVSFTGSDFYNRTPHIDLVSTENMKGFFYVNDQGEPNYTSSVNYGDRLGPNTRFCYSDGGRRLRSFYISNNGRARSVSEGCCISLGEVAEEIQQGTVERIDGYEIYVKSTVYPGFYMRLPHSELQKLKTGTVLNEEVSIFRLNNKREKIPFTIDDGRKIEERDAYSTYFICTVKSMDLSSGKITLEMKTGTTGFYVMTEDGVPDLNKRIEIGDILEPDTEICFVNELWKMIPFDLENIELLETIDKGLSYSTGNMKYQVKDIVIMDFYGYGKISLVVPKTQTEE